MKKILFLFIFYSFVVQAQKKTVNVYSERDSNNGTVTIDADNNTKATYTLMINFTTLQNTNHSFTNPYLTSIEPGKNTILILNKSSSGGSIRYSYKYNFRKGCFKTVADKDIIYMLPSSENKDVTVKYLKNFSSDKFGNELPKDWVSYGFLLSVGDTVFAARKGKVIQLKHSGSVENEHSVYDSKRSGIVLEHKDCTFGKYSNVDHFFVKEGEMVYPGQALGILMARANKESDYMIFSIYYPDIKTSVAGKLSSENIYIPALFDVDAKKTQLEEGVKYRSKHRFEIISQEMKKKEIKKYKKQHKV